MDSKTTKLTSTTIKPAKVYGPVLAIISSLLLGSLSGCQRNLAQYNPALAGAFFPLAPNSIWTYRIQSKSQKETYVITDKVLGVKYVPSLNVTGQVVEEFYNLDRGGSRPIVYVSKDGYLSRLSGLEYSKDEIETPAWGRSEEGEFMPARMAPDVSWNSMVFPFGHIDGAFDIRQSHHTVFDTSEVAVPGGHFNGCIRIDTMATYEGGSFSKSKKNSNLLYRDWYAPNVGLIKTEVLEGGENGPRMELVELLKFASPAVRLPPAGASTAN
jgi:hypothetical protein